MARRSYPWLVSSWLTGRPDVGALMGLCEENFTLMRRLAPGLPGYAGALTSVRPGGLDLHLEILGQSRYTTLARLTYYFPGRDPAEPPQADPDASLRVYHDARQVEVLDLRQSILPLRTQYAHPALSDKWQANLFLSKWLAFCVRQGHRFGHRQAVGDSADVSAVVSSCLARS